MQFDEYPLPVLHGYAMPPQAASRLVRMLGPIDRKRLRTIESLPGARIPVLSDAAALLATLAKSLQPSALIVSTFGLREGLLYGALTPEQQAADPLISGTQQAAARQARFDEHGDLLFRWISPLFEGEAPRDERLRHAACLLGDVAWAANPEFRAERGVDVALHGNWVGVDARGRCLMAQALHTSFGANGVPAAVTALLDENEIAMATRWGLAMRLGQRFSGGAAGPLLGSRLEIDGDVLRLIPALGADALYGEVVERRHRQLALAMGLVPQMGVGSRPLRYASS